MSGKTFEGSFGDKRLAARGNELVRGLIVRGTHSVRQFSSSNADLKGNYRFLENERTTVEAITASMSERCAAAVKDRVVLSIQDTTEINLGRHNNRIKHDQSIGPINDSFNGIGFKIHPSLVVNAYTYYPYGYSAVHLWAREEGKEKRSRYEHRQLTVDQKETNTWLQSNERTYQTLSKAKSVIIIQDREGDFYEQFATVAEDGKFYLLVRSNHNRMLAEGIRLWDYID